MTTTVELIKQLREETKAGVLNCRKALEEANNNYKEALALLREQAEAEAARRANREATRGRTHSDGRIGVMVEINTETDFANRSDTVRSFAREIALHIDASNPRFVSDEEIPAGVLGEEAQKSAARARSDGKPETLIPSIVDSYLKKFKDTHVLLRQSYIRNEQVTIGQLLSQTAAAVGENIVIRRFVRWEMIEPEAN